MGVLIFFSLSEDFKNASLLAFEAEEQQLKSKDFEIETL